MTKQVNREEQTITIVGAGITGCFLALLLAKRGYMVSIYEKSSHEEIIDNASKRSYNLTFYGYAVDAFKRTGLWEYIRSELIVLKESMTQVGKQSKSVYVSFHDEMEYYTVQRAQLLKILIREANKNPNITFHFDSPILAIDREKRQLLLQKHSSGDTHVRYSILFGTDGVNSPVRISIQQGQKTEHVQSYETWEYKQVVISQQMAKKLGLESSTQYSWTRKHAVIIAFPTLSGSFSLLCILPKNAKGFDSLRNKEAVGAFLDNNFSGLSVAEKEFTHDLLHNPRGGFVTITTSPWFYQNSIAILGDAAHACLPFYGIGMSIGMGDCLLLDSLIDRYHDDWNNIFPLYQERRKQNTDIISQLCKESFNQFRRDKIADYVSIYNKVENILHAISPQFFLPPLFHLVVNNPDHAYEMYQKHRKQRKIFMLFGMSFLIWCFTWGVYLYEEVQKMVVKD